MPIIQTPIKDLVIYEPKVFHDDRGYFFESYNKQSFEKELGYSINFVQDNQARSVKNVLRGLHFQNHPQGQTKLIRVLEGTIWDVAVDLRTGSETYGKWFGVELSAENRKTLLLPRGFAHGFLTLKDHTIFTYKCTDYYAPETEGAVRWDSCGIDWPLSVDPILSDKDATAPALADFRSPFIYGENS